MTSRVCLFALQYEIDRLPCLQRLFLSYNDIRRYDIIHFLSNLHCHQQQITIYSKIMIILDTLVNIDMVCKYPINLEEHYYLSKYYEILVYDNLISVHTRDSC